MLKSHARNGNEFRTLGHSWLPAKCWDTLFLNSSNPKLIWNSWNLACYHGMAPDMLWYFLCPFWEKKHSNNSQQRHFQTNSRHSNLANVCIIQIVCVMLTLHVTPRVFVLMAIGGAVRTTAWLNGRRASVVPCAGWPRGVQAVIQCAGSPGSMRAARYAASLVREAFDSHGCPPCSHPLH